MSSKGVGRPALMLVLFSILLAMVTAILVGLYAVNAKHRQYSAPGLHTEVWQSYQLHAGTRQLIETAERYLEGHTDTPTLIQRLGVVQSLLTPLRRTDVFSHLREPRPDIETTLGKLEALTNGWASQLSWQDTTAAEPIAHDMTERLPDMLDPTHRIIVAANIAVANQLDDERHDLQRTFQTLAGTLLVLGLGCIPLTLKLWRDHRATRRLTKELSSLNQSLERRVEERTQRLNERKTLLSTILDSSPSDVALIGAADQHVYYVSEALRRRALTPEAFQLRELFVDDHQYELFQQRLATHQPLDNWEAQLSPRSPYWALLSVRHLQLESQPAWLIWSLDITERKRMERELKQLATTDALTGLPNRRTFLLQSIKQLRRTCREGKPCSALAIDIDFFKRVNDEHGHQVGDMVLQEVAQRLDHHLQDIGLLGRLGGEEFAALLPGISEDEAQRIAEILRHDIETLRPRTERGRQLALTISIGIATQWEEASPKHLLIRADEALYRAKANGRNRCECLEIHT